MSTPTLVVARALGHVVITVHGPLDGSRTPLLRRLLEDLVRNERRADMDVDLRDVPSIDEDTADMLVIATRWLDEAGGRLSVGASPEVESFLAVRGVPVTTATCRRRRSRPRR